MVMLDSETLQTTSIWILQVKKLSPPAVPYPEQTFSGNVGLRAIIRLVDTLNNPLPSVPRYLTLQENYSSIVNDNGMVYLTGLQDWLVESTVGVKSTQMCTAAFSL